ncbi:hypothetical protein Bhyg_05687 [Pseudolycoriella hygida]|uniref:Hydrophobin n=1 Tax=Pseudolycoriella hygida TaxID=35572 RepID=A0A9Q0S280_9DIPT|nr:hypothetical protein Bhyg_05687 [Pseudolycoriella hygida]
MVQSNESTSPKLSPDQNACDASGGQQACCNIVLNCLIQPLGSTCNGEAYCCQTRLSVGGLVNVTVMRCLKLLDL